MGVVMGWWAISRLRCVRLAARVVYAWCFDCQVVVVVLMTMYVVAAGRKRAAGQAIVVER